MTEKAISNHNLGKCAARYKRLREAGREDRVEASMEDDAITFGVPMETFVAQVDAYTATKPVGKRAFKALKREAIRDRHLVVCGFINQIILTGQTDLAEFQTALSDLATESDGWVLMTAARKDKESGTNLFTINDTGWHDGSNRQNQYSDRPQPAGKSKRHIVHKFAIREDAVDAEATDVSSADAE